MRSRSLAFVLVAVAAAGCENKTLLQSTLPAPANLAYQLEPSGSPNQPAGILLVWDNETDPALASYRIYSRGSTTSSWGLRGETTSNTFHDNGVPDLQYYVTAVDAGGNESDPSAAVTVDERLQLAQPASLTSISLNGAIDLQWSDNAYTSDPSRFKWYRIYSTGYSLDLGVCDTTWFLEGTTVAPEFLSGALVNGVPRCYGVSAVSSEGYESLWSPLRQDTPRPDARNVLVWAYDTNQAQSGFRFWSDLNQDGVAQPSELGLITNGNRTDNDFWIHRDATDSSLWIVPQSTGTSLRLYSTSPVADLTSISLAPDSGYTRNMIEAVPGYGYVFQIITGLTVRYGALRVTHVGRNYLIFDWSFQTDPGNPDLQLRGNLPVSNVTGAIVGGVK